MVLSQESHFVQRQLSIMTIMSSILLFSFFLLLINDFTVVSKVVTNTRKNLMCVVFKISFAICMIYMGIVIHILSCLIIKIQ